MKKLLALLLVVFIVLSFTACGEYESSAEPTPEPDEYSTTAHEPEPEQEHTEENVDHVASASSILASSYTFQDMSFAIGDDWDVLEQGDGAVFITAFGGHVAINLGTPTNISPDWGEDDIIVNVGIIFQAMLHEHFGATNLTLDYLGPRNLGNLRFMAQYTVMLDELPHSGIGFLVFDGEQFAIVNCVFLLGHDEDLYVPLLYFATSIHFLD
ncbi:MAG: hypothetical protein FWE08_03555 [Oscillospiraceae bacterium]|nr:hypothetical protein [Oscillospiraceae bacterium]